LPNGISFPDREGKIREEVRVKSWKNYLSPYRTAVIGPLGDIAMITDLPIPAGWATQRYDGPPVLFGHYWFPGKPEVISLCVPRLQRRTRGMPVGRLRVGWGAGIEFVDIGVGVVTPESSPNRARILRAASMIRAQARR
jgi:hypothetical protein